MLVFSRTDKLVLGDTSWIASGAIVRGEIEIGADCSINPYLLTPVPQLLFWPSGGLLFRRKRLGA